MQSPNMRRFVSKYRFLSLLGSAFVEAKFSGGNPVMNEPDSEEEGLRSCPRIAANNSSCSRNSSNSSDDARRNNDEKSSHILAMVLILTVLKW